MADEHSNWAARRPAGEPHLHVQGETPEMAAVFAEVRDAIADAIAERQGPDADPDYMAAACIAIAREIGDKMLERRPIDTEAAADFAVHHDPGRAQGPAQGAERLSMAEPRHPAAGPAQAPGPAHARCCALMSGGGGGLPGRPHPRSAPAVPGRPGPRRAAA